MHSIPLIERFEAKYTPEPNSGCWLWTGAVGFRGYGQMRVNYVCRPAHQVAYVLHRGPVPPGLELDHLCRNPACVNPDHLEPVTHVENVRRGNAGINHREKTHCPLGHAYDDENTIYNAHGGRACRECSRRRSREWQMKRRQTRRATTIQTNGGGLGL